MSSPAQSSRRLCPFRWFRLSSSLRLLGSASARNTSSKPTPLSRRVGEPVRIYAAVWLHVNIFCTGPRGLAPDAQVRAGGLGATPVTSAPAVVDSFGVDASLML